MIKLNLDLSCDHPTHTEDGEQKYCFRQAKGHAEVEFEKAASSVYCENDCCTLPRDLMVPNVSWGIDTPPGWIIRAGKAYCGEHAEEHLDDEECGKREEHEGVTH